MASHDINRWVETVRLGALMVLVGACFLFGGASRNDVAGLMVLQPMAVLCGAVFLMTPGRIVWNSVKVPLILLGALAAVMAAQLLPLPPSVWTNLPGHAPFAQTALVAGIDQPWRGISLTPDLTLASLVGLITPLAVLVGFASVPPERTWTLLPLIIVLTAVSALVGLAQVAGGPSSAFYFYDITNTDSPVGLFSNRNHQAVLLAMGWPLVAVWATLPAERRFQATKRWIAVSLAVFFLPMIVVTGSRAGLVLGGIGLIATLVFWRRRDPSDGHEDRWSKLLIPTGLFAALCVIGATIALSRDAALQRVTGLEFEEESRLEFLPTLTEIARDFFPVGAGFGSFDPLFRFYEPFELLKPTYLNHAHNDLVELIISGGLPALAVLVAFLAWLAWKVPALLRRGERGRSFTFARLGLLIIGLVLASSLVDYPQRTPLMAGLFAVACGWLSVYDRRTEDRSRPL
jgi:O-antigen ligase